MTDPAGARLLSAALQMPIAEDLCPPAPLTSAERAACAVASWSGPAQVALLVGLFLLLCALAIGGRWLYLRLWSRHPHSYEANPDIPVVFSTGGPTSQGARLRAGNSRRRKERGRPDDGDGSRDRDRQVSTADRNEPARERPGTDRSVHDTTRPGREGVQRRTSPHPGESRIADGRERRAGPAGRRFHVDEDHGDDARTVQLLPGRLQVVNGEKHGREIRFVKTSEQRYTFGRHPGDGPDHIQLPNPTVSREHAAMRFVDGQWRIQNLSTTNPLIINGERSERRGTEHVLEDGDRVEMGEIVLLFRES